MIKMKILKTLAVMAVLLSLATVPALAETKNGPLVFSDYYGGTIGKLDTESKQVSSFTGSYGLHPDVTADGKTVVYASNIGQNEIFSVPMDDSAAPTQLTTTDPSSSKENPTVSPDGETVYFQYFGSDGIGIYSVPIEGGDITPVIQENTVHSGLQITPDGENFVYRDGTGKMNVRPVSGGPATTLYDGCRSTFPHASCGYPTVSPDGTKVAFTDGYAIYSIPFSTTGGGTPTKVPGSEAGGESIPGGNLELSIDPIVSFSPDGRYIAYNALAPDNGTVWWCGGYCGYAESRWIPVEGGNYDRKIWQDSFAATQVVWAPAPDTAKPTSTAALSPQANDAGWNNGDVTVTLSATDDDGGSGVEKITYSASGAQTIAETPASGSSVDVTLDREGTTTLTYYATDKAGNVEAPKTLTVKIDKSAPTLDTDNRDGSDGITPDNKERRVSRNIEPTATFSDDMDAASLTTSAKLYQWNAQKERWQLVPAAVRVEGKTATLDPYPTEPSRLLAANNRFKVTVTTSAKNLAGIPLESSESWTFTTGSR